MPVKKYSFITFTNDFKTSWKREEIEHRNLTLNFVQIQIKQFLLIQQALKTSFLIAKIVKVSLGCL